LNALFNSLTRLKHVLLAVALLASPMAIAQEYPARQVTLVVPFSPGGVNDTVGRFLAERLGKMWNHTVVVENRPGAGSAIGTAHVTKSQPDGYTLLLVSGSLTTNAAVQKNLPFDPIKDLQPIASVTWSSSAARAYRWHRLRTCRRKQRPRPSSTARRA